MEGPARIAATPQDGPSHPDARKLMEFWAAHSGGGRLPKRQEIPCRALRSLMPYLYLMAPIDPELTDWRHRVVGSEVMERLGMERARGLCVSQTHDPELAAFRVGAYREICADGLPRISRGRILGLGRDFYQIEVVHLPIDAGNGARWILGGMFFFN
jgi:hypothetical protein